eukprot:gnl/MRDRNA2_/MRDRNA2_83178_c0_seq4.p1 gnl/MRDRNA2_/MRDRNA2_83178_c0~~gnl/MRDRNA2_/MRDRNA2_83178_c0_seq4.p1  ORF type:complete len:566 (-),score=52.44 gnl/MRDRNA2_/MRDRNA2_83178_c0_seq4:367-2064(-)
MEVPASWVYLRSCILICIGFRVVAGSVCPAQWSICPNDYPGGEECCDKNADCSCDACCDEAWNERLDRCTYAMPEGHCSKPWNGEPSDTWRDCVSKCGKRSRYWRHNYVEYEKKKRCYHYCDHVETSNLSPASVIIIMSLFAVSFGGIAMLSSRLLEVPKRVALSSGCGTAVVVFIIGLIPVSTQYPMYCAEVWWISGIGIAIFPITFLGSAASFAAMAVGVAWMTTKTRTPLAKRSVMYLMMVTLCNFCGLIGILHMSCHQEHLFGLPFYIAWIISSFITNLVLQKIVVMRAALVDQSRLPKCLKCIFCAEVILALLLFGFSMFLAIATATADHEKNAREHEELSEEEQAEKRKEGERVLQLIALSVILFTLLFILFDLIFSFASSMAMHSGLKKIQEQMPSLPAGRNNPEADGLLQFPNALDRAIFFAKVNLFLVVASVATTSLFYFSFIAMTAVLMGGFEFEEIQRRVAFLFTAWLLDSLFNDACVVFVGFGATADALTIIGQAHMRAPTHEIIEETVIGATVSAPSTACNKGPVMAVNVTPGPIPGCVFLDTDVKDSNAKE